MKKRKKSSLVNRRARFDYDLDDSILAGIVLSGAEVKSIRNGRVSMAGAFVTVRDDELWLNNMSISAMTSNKVNLPESDSSRARKLLVKRSQIDNLIGQKGTGKTIVPLEIVTGRYIKVRIASAKGKKKHDKRHAIKKRTQDREAKKAIAAR